MPKTEAESILKKEDRRVVYTDVIRDFDNGVTILRNPFKHVLLKMRNVPFLKVVFNAGGLSSVDVRKKLEKLFPYDWRNLKLHYVEVACDFNWEEFATMVKGLYIRGPRHHAKVGTTRYYGTRRSAISWCLYDKGAELVDKGYENLDGAITRVELRNNISAKERPYVEEWLSGRWQPYGFSKIMLLNIQNRWDGLKDHEWAIIRRNGIYKALQSNSISKYRKTKIRKMVAENQLFSFQYLAESALKRWTRECRETYGLINRYTGKYTNLCGPYTNVEPRQDKVWFKSTYKVGEK